MEYLDDAYDRYLRARTKAKEACDVLTETKKHEFKELIDTTKKELSRRQAVCASLENKIIHAGVQGAAGGILAGYAGVVSGAVGSGYATVLGCAVMANPVTLSAAAVVGGSLLIWGTYSAKKGFVQHQNGGNTADGSWALAFKGLNDAIVSNELSECWKALNQAGLTLRP